MNFLAPLGLLFGLFIPAVIILYLLKLKRVDQVVSSTLLWRQSLEDLKANTPFQKLKRSLLLYLQLLIMALLALAAARPVLELGGLRGQSFVVLIDQSASMSASDVSPSRLEQAKSLALRMVNDMSMGDRMMVASFSSGAQVLTPFESNKAVLRSIIQSIQPSDAPTRIDEALRVARSAADLQPNLEAVIFSDGRFAIPDSVDLTGVDLRYVPVGQSGNNVGIVDLVVRRDFSMQQNYQVLVGLQNSSSSEKDAYVEIRAAEAPEEGHDHEPGEGEVHAEPDALLDARKITLAPGARETVLFRDPGNFPAALRVTLDSQDDFTLDNQAWAVLQTQPVVNVLLVSAGNPYLERALNLDMRARLSVIAPGDYTGPTGYDLVVFDSFTPPALADGSYVFINCVPPLPGWSMGDDIEFPLIVDYDRFHPLAQHVNFDTLVINKCRNMAAPDWAEVIVEARETPLITAFRGESARGVVLAFDIYDTNWPRRVSFPIFFMNLIEWVFSNENQALMRKTGEVLTLAPPEPLDQQAELDPPPPLKPQTYTFSNANPVFYGDSSRQGFYEYRVGGALRARYAVNLLSPDESDITPRPSLTFGETTVEGGEEAVRSNEEIWRTLVILALIVLCIEWYVYVRRARYSF